MKKICAFILSAIIIISVSVPCYAYKRGDSLTLFFNPSELDSQTAGIDILVPIDEKSDEYSTFNNYDDLTGINSLISITDKSSVSHYNTNGYISYLCHFKNADIECYQNVNNQVVVNVNNLDYFLEQGSFIIAFIDSQGNILSTTNTVSIKDGLFKQFESVSVSNYQAKVNYYFNHYYILPPVMLTVLVITVILLRLKARKNKNKGNGALTDNTYHNT